MIVRSVSRGLGRRVPWLATATLVAGLLSILAAL